METPAQTTRAISLLSNSSAASAARSTNNNNFWTLPPPSSSATNHGPPAPPKLTLSAYRRPQDSVRLTDADPDRLIRSDYELLDPAACRTLGHGASSTVRLAYRRSDGRPVAVKTIAKHDALGLWSKTNRWRVGARGSLHSPRGPAGEGGGRRAPRLDEVDVLTSLRGACPGVVQLLDVYETHSEVQLVLEYCEGGDLFDCIKRRRQLEVEPDGSAEPSIRGSFTEFETATVARTLLNVLDVLHSRHIVHRDIKPENILLRDEDDCMEQLAGVKLTDFGLARLLHDEDDGSSVESEELHLPSRQQQQRSRAYSRVGSDYYAAPEVHIGSGYDTPVDIYSLGVTLYVMLCGTPPSSTSFFKSEDVLSDDEDESSCGVASLSEDESTTCSGRSELFPPELGVSSQAQDLIARMIHPDPEKRISAPEALKHEWLAQAAQEEAHEVAHRVASKLSLSSSCGAGADAPVVKPRALSFAETESFLRIGPALPVVPPSNSPTLKVADQGRGVSHTPPDTPVPPYRGPAGGTPDAVATLADACSKLASLVSEQQLHRQRRRRQRSHSHGDRVCVASSSRKRSRSGPGGLRQSKKKRSSHPQGSSSSSKKRVCIELRPDDFAVAPAVPSCANNRIGRRFHHSPMPVVFGPALLLPQHSKSPA